MEHRHLVEQIKLLRIKVNQSLAVEEMEQTISTLPRSKAENIDPGVRVLKNTIESILDIVQVEISLNAAKYLLIKKEIEEINRDVDLQDQLKADGLPF